MKPFSLGLVTSLALSLVIPLVGGANASAEPIFYNATERHYSVEVTMPNGESSKKDLDPMEGGFDHESFNLGPGVQSVPFRILDDHAAEVAHGAADVKGSYVVLPDGPGVKTVYAGVYGGVDSRWDVVLMNITGQPLTMDLVGQNGLAATRGITPDASFTDKHAIRLDPRESTYNVKAKTKDGAPLEIQGSITPGRYCVIWTDPRGVTHATTLGNTPKVEPASAKPGAKTKAKSKKSKR